MLPSTSRNELETLKNNLNKQTQLCSIKKDISRMLFLSYLDVWLRGLGNLKTNTKKVNRDIILEKNATHCMDMKSNEIVLKEGRSI